jgi:hypothetical protein
MKRLWVWAVLSVPIAIIGFILFDGAAVFWDMHQVRHLCVELHPGTPYSKIRPAIERHGLWNGLVAYQFEHEETQEAKNGIWEIAVPAVMTYGDMECSISHNHVVVLSTEVLGP